MGAELLTVLYPHNRGSARELAFVLYNSSRQLNRSGGHQEVVPCAVDQPRSMRTLPTVYTTQLSLAKRYRRTSARASMSKTANQTGNVANMEFRAISERDAAAVRIQSFVRAVQARKR